MLQQLAGIAAALLLTAGTATPLPLADSGLSALLSETNAAHARLDAPRADLSAYYYDFENGKPQFTVEDGSLLEAFDGNRPADNATISASDAKAEVAWLFRLLRTQYGLYTWSGGDAAFEAAQNSILAALPENGTLSLSQYDALLAEHFSFVKDAHFMINRTNMWHPQTVYSDESLPFFYKNGAFYADAPCTQKVLSVNGQAPDKMIRRAIGQNGELTWYLYATAPKAENYKAIVQYTDKTETQLLRPTVSFESLKPKAERFEVRNLSGVPYVEINEMFFGNDDSSGWADLHDEDWKQKVLQTATDLKKYPAAVIDISHNPGGNGDLPLEWFERYTGQEAQPNYCTLRIRPSDVWARSAFGAQTAAEIAAVRADWDAMFGAENGFEIAGNYYISLPSAQFLPNDGPVLFVVTSRATQSAAEGFTDTLHNLQNVVTIGSNTGGVLTNGANYGLKLPYSALPFQFGECLFLWDKAYFEEGRGMEPDLYLTGENLDARLSQFLARYVNAEA